jgi:hypothetical protein
MHFFCSYNTCGRIRNSIGTRFQLYHPVAGCSDVYFDGKQKGVPAVYFDSLTPPTNPTVTLDTRVIEVDSQYYQGAINQELFVKTALADTACQLIPAVTGKPPEYTVVGIYKNEHWLHDPRFVVFNNTVDSPKADGGGAIVKSTTPATADQYLARCANTPFNFLNEKTCFLSNDPNVCAATGSASGTITLTYANFEKVFDASAGNRYIYAVQGLRQDPTEGTRIPYAPPCTASTRSRWIKVTDCSFGTPAASTSAVLASRIRSSTDTNPYVRDILFPAVGSSCAAADVSKYNFRVNVDGQCWLNVHQEHLQVFDFTAWVAAHNGGMKAIQQFAVPGNYTLSFPSWHDMVWFYVAGKNYREDLGRLGDSIELGTTPAVDAAFAVILPDPVDAGSGVVCGSPYEVANKPELFGSLSRGAFDAATAYFRTTTQDVLMKQRLNIWMIVALQGEDLLRQKVAWALSQVLVVTPESISRNEGSTEMFMVRLLGVRLYFSLS